MPQTERLTLAQAVAQMTPESIRGWLKAQPPGRTFRCGSATKCIISEYLSELTSLRVITDYESIYTQVDPESYQTPEWCGKFMRRFDKSLGDRRGVKSTLRILREAIQGYRGEKKR